MSVVKRGEVMASVLAEGSDRKVGSISGLKDMVIVLSNDSITGPDLKLETLPGKGQAVNQTACNVFRFFSNRHRHLPTAFRNQITDRAFMADRCRMIPLEVIVRREAWGCYLKRYPGVSRGFQFAEPTVELFFKGDQDRQPENLGRQGYPFVLIKDEDQTAELFDPALPVDDQPGREIDLRDIFGHDGPFQDDIKALMSLSRQFFKALEEAWWCPSACRLVDCRFTFGRTADWRLVLAGAIDNGSWRLVDRLCYRRDCRLDGESFGSFRELKEARRLISRSDQGDQGPHSDPSNRELVLAAHRWAAERTGRWS